MTGVRRVADARNVLLVEAWIGDGGSVDRLKSSRDDDDDDDDDDDQP